MLEQQQEKLVLALRELYNRLERHERWPGAPLPKTAKGFPLTHDILERIGMLNLDPDGVQEQFEDNPDILLLRMAQKVGENAYPTPNTIQSEFSPHGSEVMDAFASSMSKPMDHVRPSPILRTPEEQAFLVSSPIGLSPAPPYTWFPGAYNCPEGLHNCDYAITPNYEDLTIKQERANPCLPMYSEEFIYTETGDPSWS